MSLYWPSLCFPLPNRISKLHHPQATESCFKRSGLTLQENIVEIAKYSLIWTTCTVQTSMQLDLLSLHSAITILHSAITILHSGYSVILILLNVSTLPPSLMILLLLFQASCGKCTIVRKQALTLLCRHISHPILQTQTDLLTTILHKGLWQTGPHVLYKLPCKLISIPCTQPFVIILWLLNEPNPW